MPIIELALTGVICLIRYAFKKLAPIIQESLRKKVESKVVPIVSEKVDKITNYSTNKITQCWMNHKLKNTQTLFEITFEPKENN